MATHPRAHFAWILYDGANSAFATLILTFVYATFFTKSIAPDAVTGAAWWGYALGFSGFLLAFLAPIAGVIADQKSNQKNVMLRFMAVCASCVALMWFVPPSASLPLIIFALGLLVMANIAMELSQVFYNALLRRVADDKNMGSISAAGWGVGYAGGLLSLVIVLFGFVGMGDIAPLITLPTEHSEHVRIVTIFVALWMVVFSIPAFLYLPKDHVIKTHITLKSSLVNLIKTAWADKARLRFLVASAIYRDGLNTVFAVGGIYAATRFDLATAQILLLGILLNVTAGIGCAAAVWCEKRFRSLAIIKTCLVLLSLGFVVTIFAPNADLFFIAAAFCGLFIGPIQASSRSFMAQISPAAEQAGQFGLYALTGKALAFLGPLLFAVITDMTGRVELGFGTCLLFFVIGFFILRPLR